MNARPYHTFDLWVLMGLVLGAGVGSYIWMTAPADENRALMRYVRPVTNSVNPFELQAWAFAALEDWKFRTTNSGTTPFAVIPEFIRTNPPPGLGGRPHISFQNPDRESRPEPYVVISYFGGFGSWGVIVGSSNYWLPETRHCYEWIPGVYIQIHP